MKRKNLVSVIIWLVVTLTWLVLLIVGIFNQESIELTVIRGLCVVMSLVNVILNYIQYRKAK